MPLCLYFLWVGAGAWPCCHKGEKHACYEKNTFLYIADQKCQPWIKNKTWTLYSTKSLSLRENLSTWQRQLNLCTSKADRNEKTNKQSSQHEWHGKGCLTFSYLAIVTEGLLPAPLQVWGGDAFDALLGCGFKVVVVRQCQPLCCCTHKPD